MKTENHKIL